MSYFQFLLIFIFPPLALGLYFFNRSRNPAKALIRKGVFALATAALIYTSPWDNYLVKSEVWSYPAERVMGKIAYVPIEEYMFFILQSFLTGFWYFFVSTIFFRQAEFKTNNKIKWTIAALLTGFWIFSALHLQAGEYRYFSLILVWSVPVLLLQWTVGASYLFGNLKLMAASLLPPTIYLCFADSYAIHAGIWSISKTQSLQVFIGNLPFEEALFFLMTNLMLIMGLLLFQAMAGLLLKRREVHV